MGTYFSDREFSLVEGAENAFHSPIPHPGRFEWGIQPPAAERAAEAS